jgi:hypothetical protein
LVADGSQPERPAGQILRTLAADHAGTASEQVFVLGGHQERESICPLNRTAP